MRVAVLVLLLTALATATTYRITRNPIVVEITFDKPMVQSDTPLKFDPPLSGQFHWTSDRTVVFRPDRPRFATRYVITTNVKAQDGAAMDETWSFDTDRPMIVGYWPDEALRKEDNLLAPPAILGPNDPIYLRFNQPVRAAVWNTGTRDGNGQFMLPNTSPRSHSAGGFP